MALAWHTLMKGVPYCLSSLHGYREQDHAPNTTTSTVTLLDPNKYVCHPIQFVKCAMDKIVF